MSERDVLNPNPSVWEEDIEDSMTPDYGLTRKRPLTQGLKKAVGGTPYTRDLANTGHTFSLSWIGRTWKCVQRLKRWQEQFEDDFFTIIDWDGGKRHYVGRFTSEVEHTEGGNQNWNVMNVRFEEIPTVSMLKYPNDWAGDGVIRYPRNGFGDQKLAVNGTWVETARVFSGVGKNTFDNSGATAGDWAQYEYRGYGFRLRMLMGPEYGPCSVYLDGVLLGTASCNAAAEMGPQIVFTKENVSLDLHRVKVVMPGPAGSAPAAVSWYALEVMR